MHVVLAGGGSAGHIEPALNLADALRQHDRSISITLLGTARGLEVRLVPARGYDLQLIPAVPMPRRPNGDLVSLPFRLRRAISEVRHILTSVRADVVVGFGGYVALPAYLGARNRVPFVVHEANAKAGLANRVGARFTKYVAETVPGSLPGATLTGVPLRPSITSLDRQRERAFARDFFGLDPELETLFVFGGSQGARRLNTAVRSALPLLAAAGVQVLHAFGQGNDEELQANMSGSPPYIALPYIERMDLAYAAADLAVCRAGMMTVSELTAVGLPAIYVPLPIGNGEQKLNAAPVVAAGGGRFIIDDELTGTVMAAQVIELLTIPTALESMGLASSSLGVRDAGEKLRALVLAAAGTSPPARGSHT